MNQRERILLELKKGSWFSLAHALSLDPPIYRLSERVREISRMGYQIRHRKVSGRPYEEYQLVIQSIKLPPAFPPKEIEAKGLFQ